MAMSRSAVPASSFVVLAGYDRNPTRRFFRTIMDTAVTWATAWAASGAVCSAVVIAVMLFSSDSFSAIAPELPLAVVLFSVTLGTIGGMAGAGYAILEALVERMHGISRGVATIVNACMIWSSRCAFGACVLLLLFKTATTFAGLEPWGVWFSVPFLLAVVGLTFGTLGGLIGACHGALIAIYQPDHPYAEFSLSRFSLWATDAGAALAMAATGDSSCCLDCQREPSQLSKLGALGTACAAAIRLGSRDR